MLRPKQPVWAEEFRRVSTALARPLAYIGAVPLLFDARRLRGFTLAAERSTPAVATGRAVFIGDFQPTENS